MLKFLFRSLFLPKYRIFISYSRKHEGLAQSFHSILAPGSRPFVDKLNIRVGENWQTRLDREIADCTHLYVLWCQHASESQYVADEIDKAEQCRKIIVPVRIGSEPLTGQLSKYHGPIEDFVGLCTEEHTASSTALAAEIADDLEDWWLRDKARVARNRTFAASLIGVAVVSALSLAILKSNEGGRPILVNHRNAPEAINPGVRQTKSERLVDAPSQPSPTTKKKQFVRVVGIKRGGSLGLRSDIRMSTKLIVTRVPFNATGLKVRKCEVVKRNTWCQVDYQDATGWAPARHLELEEGR